MPTRPDLREELVAMRGDDEEHREKLLQAGLLESGYHPAMHALHFRDATRIREVIVDRAQALAWAKEVGWRK